MSESRTLETPLSQQPAMGRMPQWTTAADTSRGPLLFKRARQGVVLDGRDALD
jgi:hypothetical protein